MNTPAQTIAPCPFCGGIDNIEDGARFVWVHAKSSIKDTDCALRGLRIPISTWNRRPAPPDAILEGLKDPNTVLVMMLRGTIASPDVRSFVDRFAPEGYELVKAHPPAPAVAQDGPREQVITEVELTDKGCLVFGQPSVSPWLPEDEGHNCDAMGCASVGDHVLAKVPFTDQRSNVSVETGALYLKDQDGPGGASHS